MAPPRMSQEWQEFEDTLKDDEYPKSLPTSLSEFRLRGREQALRGQQLLKEPKFAILADNVTVENTYISLPEVTDHKFHVRIYKPTRKTNGALPVMIHFPGGYWCTSDCNSEDFGNRAIIAPGNDIIIVSFAYRTIPEVKWHTVFEDAEFGMKWLATNAPSLGGDTSKGFLVGGAESGAHLAAICAIRARNRYLNIKIISQNLIVPTTLAWPDPEIPEDWKKCLTSHTENAEAPVLTEKLYETFLSALGVPDDEKRKGENFPAWASLEGLPLAYIPIDECDPIRAQAFLYSELLHAAGVRTRTDYYKGLPNIFVQFPQLSSTLKAGVHLAAGIAWLLQERR